MFFCLLLYQQRTAFRALLIDRLVPVRLCTVRIAAAPIKYSSPLAAPHDDVFAALRTLDINTLHDRLGVLALRYMLQKLRNVHV